MGEIVRNWLTFKLGLEIPSTSDPEDFRKELANGILFAEVLRKYGILSDDEFVSLRHNNSKKSRAKNMLAIQNWVTRSGMPISHGMLMGVAQEKLGAGVKFLYELYLWLEDGCRQPEVGARAKSFLQMRSFSTAWEGSKFGSSYRPSVAPSKLSEPIDFDPCIAIERKWERSLSLTDGDLLYPPDVDLDTRQPNWYTTLDPVPAPAMTVSTAPFKEVGEAAEAENKYFIEESVEILKRQQQLLEASKYRREKELAKMRYEPIPWESYTFCPAQGNCERRLRKLKEQCFEVKQTWSEMDNFDKEKKLASKKAKCKNNKKQQIEPVRVYCDGRGDAEQLRKSVGAIKKRRHRMAEESEARALMRRVTSKRLAQDVPCIMYYTMRDDVMGCISRLPSSERLLAEFIYQGHKQRESIIRHTIYEAGQLELAREFDLTKQFQAKLAEEELELELSEFKLEQPVRSLVDPDEEAIRLDNEAMAEALLKNLTRLVSKVAAYRSTAGRECIEHDIYPATLEEGIEAEYRVVLEGNEFVMEPSRWGGLGSETAPREPDPPLLQLTPELTREDDKFLIKHIAVILDRFLQGESGSLIPVRNFTAIIEDLILASIRCAEVEDRREYLPPAWLHLTPPLLNRLVSLLMGRRGFINWRNFIIACLDLPYPDQRELIAALQQFQDLDPSGLFCTDKNGFDQVTLWFEAKKEDETHTLLDVFKALHVRECLFYMFADVQGHFYYVDFLLYFAKDTDPILGIVKALAVLTGRTIATSSLTKGATLAYVRGRTSESLLTDSDMDLFLEGTVVPQKRGSLVPPNSPKRKFDFSSRMAALRHRYQLFTSGPAPEAPPLMEPDQSDPNALLARLTEEEEKTLTSRLAESERKRKQKICAKIRREKHERHKLRHHHHRRESGKSSLTSLESEVRLHDLDRLKLLFEKELEKEDEGETDSPDVETRSKSGREEVKSEDPPQTPLSNLEPDEATFGISQSVMRIHPHARTEASHSPSVMFIHGHTDDEAPHSGVTTAMAHQGGGESSPGSGHESRESQTQTDDEEEGEYEGEFEEEWYEEEPELGATTIPSEAFLQAIWFGHITSFPVNDPSFMSADYFKYKEFLEVAYEELYEKAAMIDGEIYVSYLTQILEHPFVVEIIRRFATYRIVNLQKALNEVMASVAPQETSSSDPANELSTAFNPDEQAEDEIEGEYDDSLMRVGSKVRIVRTASTSKRGKRSRRRSSKANKSATDLTKRQATRPTTVKFEAPKNTDAQSTAASKKTKNSGKAEKKDKKRKK